MPHILLGDDIVISRWNKKKLIKQVLILSYRKNKVENSFSHELFYCEVSAYSSNRLDHVLWTAILDHNDVICLCARFLNDTWNIVSTIQNLLLPKKKKKEQAASEWELSC